MVAVEGQVVGSLEESTEDPQGDAQAGDGQHRDDNAHLLTDAHASSVPGQVLARRACPTHAFAFVSGVAIVLLVFLGFFPLSTVELVPNPAFLGRAVPVPTMVENGAEEIYRTAHTMRPVSDKFTDHTYQTMYGRFLIPLQNKTRLKLFEIGLGCMMNYGAGASSKLWQHLFPQAEIWEAEYDAECVRDARRRGLVPKGVHIVIGDQGDPNVVDGWARESGGLFDVVIDDGGHTNTQIKVSFDRLWPHVLPGGVYFIEDLHVGRVFAGSPVMSDVIQDWIEQLIISQKNSKQGTKFTTKLPPGVEAIFCQHEACAITKQGRDYPGKEWE